MTLKIDIQNEMLCGSALFSLLKKFIAKLEDLCGEAGECSVANIELGEICEEQGRTLQMARFDLQLSDNKSVQVAASAKTLEDAILNAFDHCERRVASLLGTRL